MIPRFGVFFGHSQDTILKNICEWPLVEWGICDVMQCHCNVTLMVRRIWRNCWIKNWVAEWNGVYAVSCHTSLLWLGIFIYRYMEDVMISPAIVINSSPGICVPDIHSNIRICPSQVLIDAHTCQNRWMLFWQFDYLQYSQYLKSICTQLFFLFVVIIYQFLAHTCDYLNPTIQACFDGTDESYFYSSASEVILEVNIILIYHDYTG